MRSPQNPLPIMLVDDDEEILRSFSLVLRASGIKETICVSDANKVVPTLRGRDVACILLDLTMPGSSGLDVLSAVSEEFPLIPVIVVSAQGELDTAVACMKAGAYDYLVKPVERERLCQSVRTAIEFRDLRSQVDALRKAILGERLEEEGAFEGMVTASSKMRAIFQYVGVVAVSSQPVLITGETGVGKELVAEAVHRASGRSGRFVAINVAGLDDTVFSDTLFGHKKGAYTGAEANRDGLVASASSGTLFLDEIGDTKESSQVKLLRLLQEQKYYPLGSDTPRESDVRVVVATNHDLASLISSGRFRKDLYYRLKAHCVHIPPLRERPEDIMPLLHHFMAEAAKSLHKKSVPAMPSELPRLLSTYPFPGNVRELQGMVFDAVARHTSGVISMESFKEAIGKERASFGRALAGDKDDSGASYERFPTLKEAESDLIARAMKLSGGNQGIAASMLGMTRQALNKRLSRSKAHD